MTRKPFTYRGCNVAPERMPSPTLVACNRSVNRYLAVVWRVTLPDGTWFRIGTKLQAMRHVERLKP